MSPAVIAQMTHIAVTALRSVESYGKGAHRCSHCGRDRGLGGRLTAAEAALHI